MVCICGVYNCGWPDGCAGGHGDVVRVMMVVGGVRVLP